MNETKAGTAVHAFIDRHRVVVENYGLLVVDECSFFPPVNEAEVARPDLKIEWSRFNAHKDSYFYSNLMLEAVRRYGESHFFSEQCAGSAIPILSGLVRNGVPSGFTAELYDVDPQAVAVAAKNIASFGWSDQIRCRSGGIEEYFVSGEPKVPFGPVAICVNPPYIPFPKVNQVPPEFLPVAAGPDGLKFTKPFLEAKYSPDQRLILEWSSLADPETTIDEIESRFEVEYATACDLPFGTYTRKPIIYDYLMKLRDEDKSYFQGEPGKQSQILFGVILKPKKDKSA